VSNQFNPRAQHVAGGLVADEPQAEPVVAVADVVDEQLRRTCIVADDHVEVAIIIYIAKGCAPARLRTPERAARPIGYLFEPSVTKVPEQQFPLVVGKRISMSLLRDDGAVDG